MRVRRGLAVWSNRVSDKTRCTAGPRDELTLGLMVLPSPSGCLRERQITSTSLRFSAGRGGTLVPQTSRTFPSSGSGDELMAQLSLRSDTSITVSAEK